jgi:hypothetical protein
MYAYFRLGGKSKGIVTGGVSSFFAGRIVFFVLLFIYTLFLVYWAQSTWSRSLASFPDFTFMNFAVCLLTLTGTVFICLYSFENEPHNTPADARNDGLNMYFVADSGGKLENIRRNPRVCLAVFIPVGKGYMTNARGLQMWGKA